VGPAAEVGPVERPLLPPTERLTPGHALVSNGRSVSGPGNLAKVSCVFYLSEPPVFTRLTACKRVLIAGAGGGFDVYAGLPLALALVRLGKQVHLANLSFARLDALGVDDWIDQDVAAVGPWRLLSRTCPRALAGNQLRPWPGCCRLRFPQGRRPAAAGRLPLAHRPSGRYRRDRPRRRWHRYPPARRRGGAWHPRRGHD